MKTGVREGRMSSLNSGDSFTVWHGPIVSRTEVTPSSKTILYKFLFWCALLMLIGLMAFVAVEYFKFGYDRKVVLVGKSVETAAYELLKRTDVKPVVFEATGKIVGISQTNCYKGNRIDIGGHRFF